MKKIFIIITSLITFLGTAQTNSFITIKDANNTSRNTATYQNTVNSSLVEIPKTLLVGTDGLPTSGLTDAQLRATALPVSISSMPTTPVTGAFFQTTQPISATTLPLPIGASTSALQTTGNSSLSSIDTKTPTSPLLEAVYSVSFITTPPATPTDIIAIVGSATKTIRVKRIVLYCTQTTAGINQFFFVKRSTDNTGGTSTAPAIVPHSSTSATATALIRQYTANPTALGTIVGTVINPRVLCPALTSLVNPLVEFDFTNNGVNKGVDLIGVSQLLSINFNGVALPAGLSVAGFVEFSEI